MTGRSPVPMSVPNEHDRSKRHLGVSQEPHLWNGFIPDATHAAHERAESGRFDVFSDSRGSARSEAASADPLESQGAQSAPPWYIPTTVSNDRDGWRLIRFQRRQRSSGWLIGHAREAAGLPRDVQDDASSTWVRPMRPARCRWRVAATVGVHSDKEHGGHYSGLSRCGSVWACPVCAAVIRARRAKEIGAAAELAEDKGHGLLFTTLTLRHRDGDGLAPTLDLLMEAWRKVQGWQGWRDLKKRVGYVGAVRATEVTYGGNGWHPHSHLLMVTEKPLSDEARAEFEATLSALWIRSIQKLGGRLPTREHGVVVKSVDDSGGIKVADYLAKVQENVGERRANIAAELVRGDLKNGRADSLAPFELLDAQGDGSERARGLWIEYVEGTHARRALSWTKGLREYLLPDEEELSDEEVIEDAEQAELVAIIEGDRYDACLKNRPEYLAAVLEAAEAGEIEWIEELLNDESPPEPVPDKSRVRFTET